MKEGSPEARAMNPEGVFWRELMKIDGFPGFVFRKVQPDWGSRGLGGSPDIFL